MLRRATFNFVYMTVAVVALPFALWRWVRHGKATPALWRKVTGRIAIPTKRGTRIWVHAVSVGEVLQVRPLIRTLRQSNRDIEFVLSTTTASGLKLAREKYNDCTVVPFPFDFSWAVSTAFQRIAPDAVVLVELELWPNFIAEANRRSIPLVVANGRLSENSHARYQKFGFVTDSMFRGLTEVCAQNDVYGQRFIDLGVNEKNVSVTGSIKFDGLAHDQTRPEVQQLRTAFGLSESDTVLMAGSTHDPEEATVADAWMALRHTHPELKLLIVPRHPERFDAVAEMLENRGLRVNRRSMHKDAHSNARNDSVMLLDTVGELSACWGLADIAFVGGTLTKRGGQNMLEPAAYGCPVLMGPNVWNFAEIAQELLQAGGTQTVRDRDELTTAISAWAGDRQAAAAIGAAAKAYAGSHSGASRATADTILELIENTPDSGQVTKSAAA